MQFIILININYFISSKNEQPSKNRYGQLTYVNFEQSLHILIHSICGQVFSVTCDQIWKIFLHHLRNVEYFQNAMQLQTPVHPTSLKRRHAMRRLCRSATRRDDIAHAIALAENALPIYSYAG
jgi:hypothetical protein